LHNFFDLFTAFVISLFPKKFFDFFSDDRPWKRDNIPKVPAILV